MAYIGPEPNPGQNREVDDISSGFNGSTTAFTLQVNSQNVSPGSSNNIIVSLGGVVQNPGTDFNIAASTITFTTAPASGLSFFGLVLGQQVDIQSVADSASIVTPTLSAPTVTGDLSIADKIVHTGDTNTAIRFPAADTVSFETSGSQRLRIDSSGKLLGGNYFTSQQIGAVTAPVQVQGTSADTSALSLFRYSNDNGGSRITLGKGRGTSGGAADKPQENDTVGTIHFHVANNNDLVNGNVAAIDVQMDGAPGGGDTPGRIRFLTSPDGSSTLAERMRILSDGRITTDGLDGATDITTTGVGDTFDGTIFGGSQGPLRVTRTSGPPVHLNRNGSGGSIISFRYGGSIVGSISNNAHSLPSDRNYKKNITNLTLGLDLVNKLQPVSYLYKFDADSDPVMYGLIAQDFETALNDAGVAQNSAAILQYEDKKDEKDSDYSLDYTKLTPILINAIKELSVKVAALEAA